MKKVVLSLTLVSALITNSWAQDGEPVAEIEPTPYYENYDPAVDSPMNLDPISTGDNLTDIVEETGEATGAKDGEITLQAVTAGLDVYSGMNKVETIVRGSDGWTGAILEEGTSAVVYQPAGRPRLNCPAQDVTGWFGPCKLIEDAAAS